MTLNPLWFEDGDPSFLVSGTGHVLAVEGGKVLARLA